MTDELVQQYSSENMDEQIDTVEDLKEYYRANLYDSYLESAVMSAMEEKANVVYYNEADLETMTAYNASTLSYYGMDAEALAQIYGYESAADYADGEAKNLLKQTMIIDKVAEEQGIEITDEEIDEALESYMESEGYTGTLDEFKAASGDAFMFLIRETEVKMPKVIEYLKGNVVIVETPEEETEEAADAAEESVEDVADGEYQPERGV